MAHGTKGMTDSELDSVMRHAINVELPTNFVDSTRRRIVQEQARSVVGRWLVPSAALVAVAISALVLTPSHRISTIEPVAKVTHSASGTDILLMPTLPTLVTQPDTTAARPDRERRRGVPALRAPTVASEPEDMVMVSPVDAAAYRRLYASVASTRYELVIDETNVAPAEKTVTDIEIMPIAIPPLDPAEEQGVLQ
jgi:hypothetical protein